MKTPTEVCADRIRDLEAQLAIADERAFYLSAENARLRDALVEAEPLLESAKHNTTVGEAAFFAAAAEQARAALNTHPTRITP
jgi:hypothetical protein